MNNHCIAIASAVLALSMGCERRASTQEGAASEPGSERWHTCASSADCVEGTHCADHVCVPSQKVPEGDFYAALGGELGANGDWEGAIEAYAKASSILEAAGQKAIADVHCAHGEALMNAGGDPQRAELAARVFHRCLLGAPRYTALHQRANRGLAKLREQGLDPVHIKRDNLADRYLTAAPAKPRTSNLSVAVSSTKPYRHRSYDSFVALLGGDGVKSAVLPCWEAHWKATRSETMKATLQVKHSYRIVETDDDDVVKSTLEITPAGGGGADAEAAKCTSSAIAPIVSEYAAKRRDERRWNVPVTLTVTAPK